MNTDKRGRKGGFNNFSPLCQIKFATSVQKKNF
jgi:hypothetical protein